MIFGEKETRIGGTRLTQSDFKLFLALWNQMQKISTPDLHFRIADWLEQSWQKQDLSLLLMVFRSAGKSALIGLFAAWLLYRKADLRILVLAADSALAAKMVRNVKRILEAFDAPLAARRLYVHKSFHQTPFLNEMLEWQPGKSKGHDDGLDAVAGALAQEPQRLQRVYGKGSHDWMMSKRSHKAETWFTV